MFLLHQSTHAELTRQQPQGEKKKKSKGGVVSSSWASLIKNFLENPIKNSGEKEEEVEEEGKVLGLEKSFGVLHTCSS